MIWPGRVALWGLRERDAEYWISFQALLICGNVGPVECAMADFLLIPSINSVVIPVIQSIWWADMWLAGMCPSARREVGQQWVCALGLLLSLLWYNLLPVPTLTSVLSQSTGGLIIATCGWLSEVGQNCSFKKLHFKRYLTKRFLVWSPKFVTDLQ